MSNTTRRIPVIEDSEQGIELALATLAAEREQLGLSAHVGQRVDLSRFKTSAKQFDKFWTVGNEPPPRSLALM
jgi:hypothetical protein